MWLWTSLSTTLDSLGQIQNGRDESGDIKNHFFESTVLVVLGLFYINRRKFQKSHVNLCALKMHLSSVTTLNIQQISYFSKQHGFLSFWWEANEMALVCFLAVLDDQIYMKMLLKFFRSVENLASCIFYRVKEPKKMFRCCLNRMDPAALGQFLSNSDHYKRQFMSI